MHLEQLVDLLDGRPGSLGNADLALGVDQFGLVALLDRHRSDHRVHVHQHLFATDRRDRALRLLHAGDHPRQRAKPAHPLHLRQLGPQVVHVELTLGHLGSHAFGVFGLDRLRSAFDQADDVTHAEDAAGNALRMKRLERIELLAGAGELDRLARDRAHRQRRTAAGIAIHTGQYDTRQRHLIREVLRDVHRVLAGQRVDDEQYLGRVRDVGDRLHLVHQRLVDMESTRGVEHQNVIALKLGRLHRAPGDIDRLLTLNDRQRRDIDLRAERRQLLLRVRAIDVERRHQHLFPLASALAEIGLPRRQPLRDLGGGGRLARTLETNHHDHGRRSNAQLQLGSFRTEHLDQRIADDLDDLLARRDRAQDVLADRLLGRLVDELARHGQRDVGFEQRDAHLAHRRTHVCLGQRTPAAKAVEDTAKSIAQAFEHRNTPIHRYQTQKRRRAKPRRPACILGCSSYALRYGTWAVTYWKRASSARQTRSARSAD